MFRRLFSIRGKPKEETVASCACNPEPTEEKQESDAKNEDVCVNKEELPGRDLNQETLVADVEKPERNDLENKDNRHVQKDDGEESGEESSTEKEPENKGADIKKDAVHSDTSTTDLHDELYSLTVDRAEKNEDELSDPSADDEDKDADSGIEGYPCSGSSSDFDSPKKHKTLNEAKRSLDLDKKDNYLANELANLSPIHLKRILDRKHRKSEREKECCKHCNSSTPLGSPPRKLYRSPDKKRQELMMRPRWQSGFSKRPSFRWDPFSEGPELKGHLFSKGPISGFRGGPRRCSSPDKKGILKFPNAAKKVSSENRQTTPPIGGKERSQKSPDSDTGDSDASSGDEMKHMPVRKIFSNQSALRKRIGDLEDRLRGMQGQREKLQALLNVLEQWAEELRNVDRTKLGVPYIRDVKQVLVKHRQAMNNRKSDFQRTVALLKEAEIPYYEKLRGLVEQLNKEVTVIVRDQRKFSAKSVENVRQIQGQLIGTSTAILAVYYDE